MYFSGSKLIHVKDQKNQVTFPVLIHYPTEVMAKEIMIGPYTFDVSPEAKPASGKFPLAVISHGNQGSHLIYRTISIYLAKKGYVVATPEHFGNNRNDNHLGDTNENYIRRPTNVIQTIEAIFAMPEFKNNLSKSVSIIGHSLGSYTAIAVAGGVPWTKTREKLDVPHFPGIRSLVLMAPATGWFMAPSALDKVDIPILVLMAEQDVITPQINGEEFKKNVPDPEKVILEVIPNSGHFSFLSPFPEKMKVPGFMPATDPAGFDRNKFHSELPEKIFNFLESNK